MVQNEKVLCTSDHMKKINYIENINKVAKYFPGLIDPERCELLNAQLLDLEKKGFKNLVNNFLSEKSTYSLLPFIFELYICRWLCSIPFVTNIQYEPLELSAPPDFAFQLGDTQFFLEAKTII